MTDNGKQIVIEEDAFINKTKYTSSLGGLEPPTFRLTAERANRLRHRDKNEYTQLAKRDNINLRARLREILSIHFYLAQFTFIPYSNALKTVWRQTNYFTRVQHVFFREQVNRDPILWNFLYHAVINGHLKR